MSSKDIYGKVPNRKDGDSKVVSEALSDLSESSSNKINGDVKDSRTSEYDPENGK